MTDFQLPKAIDPKILHRIIAGALEEDVGSGDITSQFTLAESAEAKLNFVARQEMIVSGGFITQNVYEQLGNTVVTKLLVKEGEAAKPGDVIAIATGSARTLLTGERVTLNLMQRMCGIATLTRQYVQAVAGTKAVILDTRKTMPGLRMLDKYAVTCGGGKNHRMRLDDMILIKDNHIAVCGGITGAIQKVRAVSKLFIEVECDTLEQVREAIAAMPDRILLDNMDTVQLFEAVKLAAGKIPLEASGGVSLSTVTAIAETGIDYISVGAITHSAPAVDIGADLKLT